LSIAGEMSSFTGVGAALIDAGPMAALFSPGHVAHTHYRGLLQQPWALCTTWPCVAEASHFLSPLSRFRFLHWLASGAVSVCDLDAAKLPTLVNVMARYTEPYKTEMDLADATLFDLAAELKLNRIMTLDVRDFSRYRLPDGRRFELL
jgi:predicted nucleic acid-binding protein